jgi:hypothetical protein
MIGLRLQISVRDIGGLFTRLRRFQRTTAIGLAQGAVRQGILTRSERGVLPSGRPMKKYSLAHLKRRDALGLRTSPPNLRLHNDMMRAIIRDGNELTFEASQQKKAEGNTRLRPFFDANATDAKLASERIATALERTL